ncbi:unnamed protein product, partial [marine sediment metagenome]
DETRLIGMGWSRFPISLWDDLTDSPGSHPPASLTLAVSIRIIKALD